MMRVRAYHPDDLPRIQELFIKQSLDYQFQDPREFIETAVLVDDEDRVVMAIGALPTVEIFMIGDATWETPGIRFEAIKFLQEHLKHKLIRYTFVEAHFFLPPQLKSFGRRLSRHLGWVKSRGWTCFSRRIE